MFKKRKKKNVLAYVSQFDSLPEAVFISNRIFHTGAIEASKNKYFKYQLVACRGRVEGHDSDQKSC